MTNAKMHFTNYPSFLLPVEEAKLNNHSTINHDNVHAGTLHWWLVHRHNLFSLTPSLFEILMIIYLLHVLCVLKIQYKFK